MKDCDDSSGSVGDSIDETIELINKIATADDAAIDIKEQLFSFLQTELVDKDYFDYGDFGYDLFSTFQALAVQLHKPDMFLAFVDAQIAKPTNEYSNYRKEHFKTAKIEFLQQTGKVEDAQIMILENLDIVEVRQGEVDKAINKKDFGTAKKLIADGIKLAISQTRTGTVRQWQEQLLRMAVLEKDTALIRQYTKYFAFDGHFSAEYYNQWKATFAPPEWQAVIENHITHTEEKTTEQWQKKKQDVWYRSVNPPYLQNLGPIYIQEKYWDRLLALVQKENNFFTVLNYHPYLLKDYPKELLAIYLPLLEEFGMKSNGRSEYVELVNNMQKIIKDVPEGKEKILGIAKMLKEKFSFKPRRPAMIEELNKLLLQVR